MIVPRPIYSCRDALLAALLALTAGPAAAQIPNTLLHSIPPPPTGAQTGAGLGYSVAVDGAYVIAGVPYDDTGGLNSGVAKVFDSSTGALLFLLPNPTPAPYDMFGNSVAISGTRVVVGTKQDGTGTPDAGSAYVYDLASVTPTIPVATLNNPSPATNDAFGSAVAISGTLIAVGAFWDDQGATDAGSVYIYDLASATPNEPVIKLNKPAPTCDDRFGISVAISGTRVVVGSTGISSGVFYAGSAYVYDLDGVVAAVPVAELHNPSPAPEDYFGYSVSISGTRVVVGAYRDDTGAAHAGSVYVYDLATGSPAVPMLTLNNPGPAAYDGFGWSVAISGTHLVVGTIGDDTGAVSAGSWYAYDLAAESPAFPKWTLNNPSPAANDQFGFSVAISGTKIVAGANGDDSGATDAGSAYVYELTSATPTVPVTTLNSPGPGPDDHFGGAIAVSGNLVVVGAGGDKAGADNVGSAYVFDLTSVSPEAPVLSLHNPYPAANDFFGSSVAISGTRIVVGASTDDTGATDAGSVYVYDLASQTPGIPTVVLNNPDPAEGELFGASVAISAERVVVGAYGENTAAFFSGRVYVYDLTSGTPAVPLVTLNNPAPAVRDYFGTSVAISGMRVVVGASGHGTGVNDAGIAYVYDLTSATPTAPIFILNNPSPEGLDFFGNSVAISGPWIAVGASGDNTGAIASGSAYIYDLAGGIPELPVITINNPGPAGNDAFGGSVAIAGTRVVIGVRNDDNRAGDSGSAYVYDIMSETPAAPVARLTNPTPTESDYFGLSVAIDGNTIAIGAPFDDTLMRDKGFAYIFGPHPLDQDSDGLRDAWEIAQFGATTGHSALDDFDHDGYSELLELAFGLNPKTANPGGLPPVTNEGGYLTMTIIKQPGVTYEVQSASTLQPGLPDSFSAASTVILANDATLKVRDNFIIGAGPRRFLRVKVTAAP